MITDAVDPEEFPLIGEPLPVEFANSLYESEGVAIDFLATPRLAQMWFELAATDASLPTRLRRVDSDAIRELRNVIRHVFCDLANDIVPSASAVSVLNRYAARGPWSVQLDVGDDRRSRRFPAAPWRRHRCTARSAGRRSDRAGRRARWSPPSSVHGARGARCSSSRIITSDAGAITRAAIGRDRPATTGGRSSRRIGSRH